MRVRVGDTAVSGRAVDLDATGVSGTDVAAAVSDPEDAAVTCPQPEPVHGYVGHVHADVSVPLTAALAAAARSLGATAPQDDAIERVETERANVDVPDVDLAAVRQRVAEAGAEEADLRERVARLGGRVEARRELDADDDAAAADLEAAVRRLSEAETERLAAEQELDRARETARRGRDARERRLRLADRAANLRREARAHLASIRYDAFRRAVAAVPGSASPGGAPDAFEGSAVTAALAVARVADLAAPVVLECGRFDDARTAADILDAAVIRV